MQRLLDLGVLPVVNENDTVADDEIRYGDNDLLAALVSHLLGAELLLMLTDITGVFTADPRRRRGCVADRRDRRGRRGVGAGRGRRRNRPGERRHGEQARGRQDRLVVGRPRRDRVGRAAERRRPTPCRDARSAPRSPARTQRLPTRKLWIAFAQGAAGRVVVDGGARRALVEGGKSLLAAGVVDVDGKFDADVAVEIVGDDGRVFAKGLSRYSASQLRAVAGKRTTQLPDGLPHEVVHRDDMVVLP